MGDFLASMAAVAQQAGGAAQQAAGSEQQTQAFPQSMMFMLIIIAAAFYFLILRPQTKEKKERERQLSTLAKGDKIVTIGGLHGKITRIGKGGQQAEAEFAKNVRIIMNRSAVSTITKRGKGAGEEEEVGEELE